MADERVVTELVLEGVQRVLRGFTSVGQAQTDLGRIQEQVGSRQMQTYEQIAKAAEDSARRQQDAATRAAKAMQDIPTGATDRPRGAGGRFISRARAEELERLRNPSVAGLGGLSERIAATQAGTQAQAAAAAQRAVQSTDQQVAALRRLATASQQAAAAQDVNTQAGARAAQQLLATAAAANRQANSLAGLVNASSRAQGGGITYLSVLSAIHAASFLATNRTFSLIGSFLTLGLAFSKVGVAASAVGLAFGGLLAIFGQIAQGVELVNQAITTVGKVIVGTAVGGTAALVGLGTASTKVAADFESQLASVRAFGGATTQQLQEVGSQAGELAKQYGISASEVVKASSLFARAGGSVQEAIEGATEAIIKLQVASQGEIQAAEAALLVAAALKQFQIEGTEAVRVADALTAAAQSSALSFLGVQQAFIQAAPGARTLGISLEDTAAAVALLGNELIKGTITGTAFKQFLLDIINPSVKAQEEFTKYGISIKAADGSIRPLVDILGDLNSALGDEAVELKRVTEADRARALAVIFGSRAALAANILTREGATGLQRFREELAQTTTSGIVNVLLLPLNKQLDILKVSVEELGRAFGGNLLGPIREVAVAAIRFVQGLEPHINLLGQAVTTVLTTQGFGQLQQKIAGVAGNTALSSFLIETVNSLRNVRDVIVNQIVPAIGQFISILSQTSDEEGRLDDIGEAFANLNTKIQQIGAATAGAIVGLGRLIREFINAEGKGGELRSTIETLARAFLTHLGASVSVTLITIQAAIVAMPILARVALVAAQAALRLAESLKELALKGADIVQLGAKTALGLELSEAVRTGAPVEELERLRRALAETDRQSEDWKKQIASGGDSALKLSSDIQKALKDLDSLKTGFDNLGPASAENARIARSSMEQLVAELAAAEAEAQGVDISVFTQRDLDEFTRRAGAMKAAAVANVNPIVSVFEDVAGQVSDSLANIIKEVEAAQREAQQRGAGTTGALDVPEVDTTALDRAREKIVELANDTARRVENAMQDMGTQVAQNTDKAVERLGDIFDKANHDLEKLQRETGQRLAEIFENTNQRRLDRARLEAVTKNLDVQVELQEEANEKIQKAEQRNLDIVRRIRQRATEDEEDRMKHVVELDEQRYKEMQENASRGFQVIQEAADRALQNTQDAEEKGLRRSLDTAAQARRDAQELADAKTPEDKAKVLESQRRARDDRKFQEGQENQLDSLRRRHEQQQLRQQQGNELAQAAFKKAQEQAFDKYRRNNELAFRQTRRTLEDQEYTRRNAEDDQQQTDREIRENKLQALREGNALKLRKFQDQLEDEANQRQATKIIRDAMERAVEIQQGAFNQAQEIFDQLELQITQQEEQLERTLRSARDAFRDFEDSLPADIRPTVIDQLNQAMSILEGRSQTARDELAKLRAEQRGKLDIRRAELEGSLQLQVPTRQQFEQQIPTQVQTSQTVLTAQALQIVGLRGDVAAGVLSALQTASQQGLLPDPSSFGIDLSGITGPLNNIQNAPIFKR